MEAIEKEIQNQAAEDAIAQTAPTEYVFTDDERDWLQGLQVQIWKAKESIHDLNVQLEQAQSKLKAVQTQYTAGLQMVAARMRMPNAQVSPDLSKMTRR